MINLKNKTPHILVIGDLMIDHYLWGSCEQISPEAPVQIVNIDYENKVLGGAGNVINNLKTLGVRVDIMSVIGDCEISDEIKKAGGFDKIVPSEGIVFDYKSNTYKLTGVFAPINQILGMSKF